MKSFDVFRQASSTEWIGGAISSASSGLGEFACGVLRTQIVLRWHLIGMHLVGVHLVGLHLTDMYLIGAYGPASRGMHLIGIEFVGRRLIGMRLMGMHLMGVGLTGMYKYLICTGNTSCSLGGLWTARHPIRGLSS